MYTTIIHIQRFTKAGITALDDLVDFKTFNFLSGQIKTVSYCITMIFNKILSSLLPKWKVCMYVYAYKLFITKTLKKCIWCPDVTLDCMSSSETVHLSCYEKGLFYNNKFTMAFQERELACRFVTWWALVTVHHLMLVTCHL